MSSAAAHTRHTAQVEIDVRLLHELGGPVCVQKKLLHQEWNVFDAVNTICIQILAYGRISDPYMLSTPIDIAVVPL